MGVCGVERVKFEDKYLHFRLTSGRVKSGEWTILCNVCSTSVRVHVLYYSATRLIVGEDKYFGSSVRTSTLGLLSFEFDLAE